MTGSLHYAALVLYGIATAVLGVSFARSDQRLPRIAGVMLVAGLVVHAGGLASYTSDAGRLPLASMAPSLSTLGFLIGVGTVIASTLGNARTVGLVLVPVVALLTGTAVAMHVEVRPAGLPFESAWFALHVVFAFVGYTGLTVAFAAGLMYLLQFRQLKGKHFGAVFRFFPPLGTLDRVGRGGLLVGFPFLTLATLVGWAWSTTFAGGAPGDSKLIWVAFSWIVFLIAIIAGSGAGRRSERGALASVVGFVVIVLGYMIIRVQATSGGFF